MKYRCITEEPAGLAAFSLWVHGGPRCRPPISRMGNKAGYAHALGALAGIRAGEGAGAYVWAEADDDVRALLRAYTDAEALRRIAEIIRGWADEEPRALWERLRAERKARPPKGEEGVAGWMTAGWLSYGQDPSRGFRATAGGAWPDDPPDPQSIGDRCASLATYAQIAASNRLINVGGPDLRNTGKGGTTFGGDAFATPAAETARGFEEVAGWVIQAQWAFRKGVPESGFNTGSVYPRVATATEHGHLGRTADDEARSVERAIASGWPPVLVLSAIPPAAALAEALGTPGDLEGVLCYADPPYVGTTGYTANLSRAEVVRHALERAAMGARVMVSESGAVAELVAAGWQAHDIGHTRRGQKRTFAANSGEWVTMNFDPVDRYERVEQVGLFG